MICSTISIFAFLLHATFIAAFADFPKRDDAHLFSREVSDPCCKSCGPIGQVLSECPVAQSDIFCGCDEWVAAAPGCQACIANVAFNTSFAKIPGPLLEIFWAFCQCQKPCRKVAEATFGPQPCAGGTDEVCVTTTLVEHGPECECCLEETDKWFASYFKIFVEQSKNFLKTKISEVPGVFPLSP